jgi:hypothetical protein
MKEIAWRRHGPFNGVFENDRHGQHCLKALESGRREELFEFQLCYDD